MSKRRSQLKKIGMMRATLEELLTFLEIVESHSENENNWKIIQKEVMENMGIDREHFYNLAQTAENLYFIQKISKKHITLLYEGQILLRNRAQIKDALAKHLIRYDSKYQILKTMLALYREGELEEVYPGSFIHISKLFERLKRNPYSPEYSLSSLKNFLDNYYVRSGLIKKNCDYYAVNMKLYRELSKNKVFKEASEIADKDFLEALCEAYFKVREKDKKFQLSPWVPIPALRPLVCKKLEIDSYVFDKKMETIPLDFEGKIIDLAAPRWRRPGGIERGGRYIYYVAIF